MKFPDSFTVRLVDLPTTQKGFICEDIDGHINVYINARLSHTGQMDAARHEYRHWLSDDLRNDRPIQEVER